MLYFAPTYQFTYVFGELLLHPLGGCGGSTNYSFLKADSYGLLIYHSSTFLPIGTGQELVIRYIQTDELNSI